MAADKILKFDEWLRNRCGMTEQEFRDRLEESREYLRLVHNTCGVQSPDEVIAAYRRLHREETDIIASGGIDYTFREWLEVYEHHTPESFHQMCAGTGMGARQEAWCWGELRKKWEKRHEAITAGSCPQLLPHVVFPISS